MLQKSSMWAEKDQTHYVIWFPISNFGNRNISSTPLFWPDAAWYHMSHLLPCLSAETEMAVIANSSDSCHAAELDASCLLSDNYILSRFIETWWLPRWMLLTLTDRHIYHLLLWQGSSKSLMWLWLWPTCSLYVTGQGGMAKQKTTGSSKGEEGLTQLRCYPSPSVPPIFFCTSVLSSCLSSSDVRWWCAVAWARD